MKTEQEIKDGINKVIPNIKKMVEELKEHILNENWDDAQETCFTILVNVAALEAAERVLE